MKFQILSGTVDRPLARLRESGARALVKWEGLREARIQSLAREVKQEIPPSANEVDWSVVAPMLAAAIVSVAWAFWELDTWRNAIAFLRRLTVAAFILGLALASPVFGNDLPPELGFLKGVEKIGTGECGDVSGRGDQGAVAL